MRKLKSFEINQLIHFGFDPFEVAKSIPENMPVEYYMNRCTFFGLDFEISDSVLIPRVESGGLVERALNCTSNHSSVNFLEVGCGSGAIGISFALKLKAGGKKFKGVLSDISDEALKVTSANMREYKLDLRTVKSDLLKEIPIQKFDVILANLPYIPSNRISKLEPSVRDFEPHLALDGGSDGLMHIRKLLNESRIYLGSEGIVLLEVDDSHNQDTTMEFTQEWSIEVERDENEKIRYWICKPRA